jgi:hypothetical protein
VDPATGLLPAPECPGTLLEAFLEGTEPQIDCRRRSLIRTARGPVPPPTREVERAVGGWMKKIFGLFR